MSNLFTFILLKNLKNIYSHKLSQDPTFCLKNGKWEEGFSILEVLVTILVITGFVLGSLQATVLATLLRVQAQDKQDTINWVQQDLELIRYRIFILDYDGSSNTYTSDATACANETYGDRLKTDLITDFPETSSNVLINDKEYTIKRTYTVNGNTLQISYQTEYDPDHPRYKGSSADNIVTKLSTEGLPNAVLNCDS
ncbi:hypothetical protein VKI22_09650 [Cyanobacterium aponinum UTEX 3221]|uniref:type IV pilus modification PilV family protein n=1 Tax=Cyanobacterium aponinum TaxID=379064 RepID=UPI002B4C0DEC|nr:hypothetical protein [Cyanobacterium aponinum]WRL36899.1 hypothetical protein VKI22_09650 [Cyanobacterium aponinum UTEX 3221]